MVICPYCGKEVYLENIIKMFKCKFNLESESLDEINKLPGEPFVTVRHGKGCFPFGVRYNSRTKQFKVEK